MKVVNYLLILASVYVLTIGPTHAAEDDHSDDSHAHDDVNEEREEHEESESTHAEISAEMAEQAGIRSKASGAGILERTISSYGRLVPNPDGIALIRARFPGQVTKINASLGDSVKAGNPMATIESNDSLQPYTLRAPFAGTVIQRNINVGELAGEQALFTIAKLDPLWVELKIFPGQRREIAPGQLVRIDTGDAQHESRISHIVPQNSGSPYVIARAEIANAEELLSPGRLVSASIVVERIEAPLVIENRALQLLDESQVVFVQEGNSFEPRPVELGRTDGQFTEILSGLKPGERYVVENSYLIKADIEKSSVSDDD